jgi:sugar phosphate isomerase/epimerase
LISISTAWLPDIGSPIEQVLDTLEPLGSRTLEFNYRVHPLDLDATCRALNRRGLTVSSLHNICSTNGRPVPEEDRYGDSVAALDESARQAGLAHLTATAQAARTLGARAVVVHGGTVEAVKESPLYRQAMRESRRANNPAPLQSRMPELLKARQATAAQNLARLIASLKEVCPLFPDIRFGLELRYHFHGLPAFDELAEVLAEVNCPNLGYWHDCGHAQFQENLGICRHEDWLKRYRERLIGVHLHGMSSFMLDHYAPTAGNMDFAMIRRYINSDTLLVMEVSPENTAESVQQGKAYLETVFES